LKLLQIKKFNKAKEKMMEEEKSENKSLVI
jgi:hypothetical protein